MKQMITIVLFFVVNAATFSQQPPKPYGPIPTAAQLKWHEMEMYCLVHYGVDTYTDKEWGYGNEDPALINPVHFNAEQIVAAAKAGGFKGVIVVAKHHDGLCLWPTKTTEHNITKSPWKNGKGDMVKEYREACDKTGMLLGVYCSPWDRNNPAYGTHEYVVLYREQLKELYSNYGNLFMSWHDGANGGDGYYGGANGKRLIDKETYYGWDTTFAIIRKMQPTAVIFGDTGPDVRWVGNEDGYAGETCWTTYTPVAPDENKKPSNGYVKYWLATEGTKNGQYWMPAECDVPLRPGWFYHPSQDGQAKSPYTLLDVYYRSVGRGADLDLGIAPNREGLLQENDVAALKGFGDLLKEIFNTNIAKGAVFTASNTRGNNTKLFGTRFLTDGDRYSYWATDDGVLTPTLTIDLKQQKTFNVIRLRENSKLGQRITAFAIEALENDQWSAIATGTSIGANRLIRLPQNIHTNKVRLRITGANACIALSDFGLFKEPPHLTAPAIKRDKNGYIQLTTDAPVASMHYTLDGSEPTLNSPQYTTPVLLTSGIIKAKSFEAKGESSEAAAKIFGLVKTGWKIECTVPATTDSKKENAIDDNEQSFFSTLQQPGDGTFPQEVVVDMGNSYTIKSFTYLPRQDKKAEGIVDKYIYYTSTDGNNWQKVIAGEFSNIKANPVEQLVQLSQPVEARYFKFSVQHVISGNGMAIAELGVQLKTE